jgi:hypothetical protein
MKKYYQFEFAKKYLFDKDLYLQNFINDMLCRCYAMFEYKNLPNTIQKQDIEKYLLMFGHCIFTKEKNDFYVFNGDFTGIENVYHRMHKYIVVNVALNLNKEYETENNADCVLIQNDSERQGFFHLFSKYGIMLNDCEISLNMLSVLNRIPYLITSADEKTKSNAELFLNKIKNGDFSIIADNAFLESLKSIPLNNTNNNQINNLMELNQYIKASAFNSIGLNANWNSKRERLNTSEISLNEDSLTPLIENMLYSRQQAIKAINEKYGLNIEVDLSNVWKQKEQEIKTTIADLQDKEKFNDSEKTEKQETTETQEKQETTEKQETQETQETTENKTDSGTKQGVENENV